MISPNMPGSILEGRTTAFAQVQEGKMPSMMRALSPEFWNLKFAKSISSDGLTTPKSWLSSLCSFSIGLPDDTTFEGCEEHPPMISGISAMQTSRIILQFLSSQSDTCMAA